MIGRTVKLLRKGYKSVSYRSRLHAEEGSSLVTVLVLVAIVTTLIGAVLTLAILRDHYIRRDVHRLQARYAAEAGIHHALSGLGGELRPTESVVPIQVGVGESVPCSVRVEPFGAFAVAEAKVTVRGEQKSLRVLSGMAPPPAAKRALVFGEDRSSLTLTGTTRITGDLLVGSRGVETSSFRGSRFTGHIDGTSKRNPAVALPAYDDTVLQDVLDRASNWLQRPPSGSRDAWKRPTQEATYKGTRPYFIDGALTLTSEDQAVFSSDVYDEPALVLATGHVALQDSIRLPPGTVLVAGKTLRVAGTVSGGPALLIGIQGVQAGGEVHLSAQLVSKRQVHIGGDAYLTYPSLAYVSEPNGRLRLSGRSQLDGWILFPNAPEEEQGGRESEVVLGDRTVVRGALYNASTTEMTGSIHGSVFARRFAFYESPTYYVNWLRDVTIDVTRRPPSFVSPFGFESSERPSIVKWRNNSSDPS
jgi:hypothetical protein